MFVVFKTGYFSCFWAYSFLATKPSIVSQSSAHDCCQQKSLLWLLNTSPPHVMLSVILYRVETGRHAGWDNGGEPEVTVPYACTMTRQWRHRGQVAVHLLPVWQLFLEVYRNQERSLLMSQHISTFFLFFPPSVLVHSHPRTVDAVLESWHRVVCFIVQDLATGIAAMRFLQQNVSIPNSWLY